MHSINLFSLCVTCSLRVLLSELNHPVVQNYVILCIIEVDKVTAFVKRLARLDVAKPSLMFGTFSIMGYNTRCSDLLRPPFAKTTLIPR